MHLIKSIIIDTDNTSGNLLKDNLSGISDVEILDVYDDILEGYNAVLENKPELVFIDISENLDLALEIIEKILQKNKNCKIAVTSYETSADLIIRAMRAGAREFINKPIIKNDLVASVEKLKESVVIGSSEPQECKIFSIFSNKGGIGKTSIATNLAYNIAEITKEKVALIDLNLQMGDVTTFLDLNPSFDIAYVANNLDRVDESFLLSTLEKYKDTSLYVLADPPYLEQSEEITADQISAILNALKTTFSYIIIDTSSNFDGKTISALDCSDSILLASIVNLPSIRNVQRCLDLFQRLEYTKDKIKIIVNRYMDDDEIKIEDVEDVLNHNVFWKIPNSYFTIISAINKGLPINAIDDNSVLANNYKDLAALLSNNIILNPKTNIKKQEKSKLFSFFKTKK